MTPPYPYMMIILRPDGSKRGLTLKAMGDVEAIVEMRSLAHNYQGGTELVLLRYDREESVWSMFVGDLGSP